MSDSRVDGQPKGFRVEFERRGLKVRDVVRSLFPDGTALEIRITADKASDLLKVRSVKFAPPIEGSRSRRERSTKLAPWELPPMLPADLFAVCAILLNLSGAAHHVVADATSLPAWRRRIVVSKHMRRAAKKVGLKWRAISAFSSEWDHIWPIRVVWRKLIEHWKSEVFTELPPSDRPPEWWKYALFGLMAADEAAKSFGVFSENEEDFELLDVLFDSYLGVDTSSELTGTTATIDGHYTISTASPDVACVLPKSRTAGVGCTLRSLSHNLALLPPRGLARSKWRCANPKAFPLERDMAPLNILAVPYPYKVSARNFSSPHAADVESETGAWFELDAGWENHEHDGVISGAESRNPDQFARFIEKAAASARRSVRSVNGVVLPEASIPYSHFKAILDLAARSRPEEPLGEIEFLVAGTSTNEDGDRGNFASVVMFSRFLESRRRVMVATQGKHHRWRLDRRQINAYGIASAFSGATYWWEQIPLTSRTLNLFSFRRLSTFVALICEDLARIEPVHDMVRSIGPNIVFALLMDGPQVSSRWPGRYAMGLSDDPGSSVLTLSSYGLIERWNNRCIAGHRNTSIGLWRDETGDTREIGYTIGSAGTLLTLMPERKCEWTLDGRADDSDSIRWVYSDQIAVEV